MNAEIHHKLRPVGLPSFLALAPVLVLLASAPAAACSLAGFSNEYRLEPRATLIHDDVPSIEVAAVDFVPWLADAGSCDGVGWLRITLRSDAMGARGLNRFGYIINAISGVNDADFFPDHPLSFAKFGPNRSSLFQGWTGITPDPDGHVRWRLAITPVSRSGQRGATITLCVSSDESCPESNAAVTGDGRS